MSHRNEKKKEKQQEERGDEEEEDEEKEEEEAEDNRATKKKEERRGLFPGGSEARFIFPLFFPVPPCSLSLLSRRFIFTKVRSRFA